MLDTNDCDYCCRLESLTMARLAYQFKIFNNRKKIDFIYQWKLKHFCEIRLFWAGSLSKHYFTVQTNNDKNNRHNILYVFLVSVTISEIKLEEIIIINGFYM